jgi:hypothetical protein
MENFTILLIVIILFIIFYLYYLEKLCDYEELSENVIINENDSNLDNYLYSLNKKDKIILKNFILELIKENTKRKEKRKLHAQIKDGITISAGIVLLDNLKFPSYTLYPIAAVLNSIIVSLLTK